MQFWNLQEDRWRTIVRAAKAAARVIASLPAGTCCMMMMMMTATATAIMMFHRLTLFSSATQSTAIQFLLFTPSVPATAASESFTHAIRRVVICLFNMSNQLCMYHTASETSLHGCYYTSMLRAMEGSARAVAIPCINQERKGFPRE